MTAVVVNAIIRAGDWHSGRYSPSGVVAAKEALPWHRDGQGGIRREGGLDRLWPGFSGWPCRTLHGLPGGASRIRCSCCRHRGFGESCAWLPAGDRDPGAQAR
ncbi:MAG: hypothetical protein GX863_02755 [Firmicutes bacterium]|nr:hypothetical protein [Candidatus Fermentithermobacillaceae bacterium]